jgi:hypothetical protein
MQLLLPSSSESYLPIPYHKEYIIYKTISLPLVSYGCKIRPLAFKEEQRLMGFENRVLRIIFGPKRQDVRGASLPNIFRIIDHGG